MKKKGVKTVKFMVDFTGNAKDWFSALFFSMWTLMGSVSVFASDIGSSKLATGTEKLITDVTTWLLIVAPLVTVVAVIYYFIRKTVSDEMDHKKWNTRISTAIICCIGVVAASLIINLIVGYYK